MKLVTAIVQPNKLADVQVALAKHGVSGMTISEASGYARQHGHTEIYRGDEFTIDFVLKVRVEILVASAGVEEVVSVISEAARTGEVGDGKIWVTAVEDVVRIRTGEHGDVAI